MLIGSKQKGRCMRSLFFFFFFLVLPSSLGANAKTASAEIVEEAAEENSLEQDDAENENLETSDFLNKGYKDPRAELTNERHAFKTPFGQISWPDIADKTFEKDGQTFVKYKGYLLRLTLQPALQASITRELQMQKQISAAIVFIDAASGKILAMADKKGDRNDKLLADRPILTSARAPAASLMKIVTATAAIELGGVEPDDLIYFRGGCGRLANQNWLREDRRDRQKLTMARAFGLSCNTAFARMAIYDVGLANMIKYSEKYMFNRPIPSDLKIETSAALLPELDSATAQEVGEAGAGFGGSKLSPIHSAMLSAPSVNNGIMMAPYIVDAAFDSKGKEVYKAKPLEISKVYSNPDMNDKMLELYKATIMSGTSRRSFRRNPDKREVGGKTGTLSDAEDRGTLYTWFSGIAPMRGPESVALSTLSMSPQNWVVRASELANAGILGKHRIERQAKKYSRTIKP